MEDEFSDVLGELAEHPGQQLVWERDSLQRALQIFFHHTDAFEEFLAEVKSEKVAGDNVPDEINDQFIIHSHDYFSAAYGLFNKAQSFQSSWYCNCQEERCTPDSCEAFEPYFNQLVESGLTKMGAYINSLRVVVQKIQTPCLLNRTKYDLFRLTEEQGVVIHRERFLDWIVDKRNRKPVVEYLEESEAEYLSLQAEIEAYRESIKKFYGWLFQDVQEKYAHQLRDRRRMLQDLE